MSDISTTKLDLLRCAIELGEFTTPQLATASTESYETVKKVLRSEEGLTVEKTGATRPQSTGRPAVLWRVTDEESIRDRLRAAAQRLRALDAAADAEPLRSDADATEDLLNIAEDSLLFALGTQSQADASRLADEALETLAETGLAWPAVETVPTIAEAAAAKWNLPDAASRAWVVATVANYLRSGEADGIAGPLWRTAFGALAPSGNPEQAALEKRVLVDLIRLATERASSAPVSDSRESVADDYRSEFFATLTMWKETVYAAKPSFEAASNPGLGTRLERLAPIVFPVLDRADQRLAVDGFIGAVTTEGRNVSVRCLLAARRESDLAAGLVAAVRDEPAWRAVASWYVGVREGAALGATERKALVEALCAALPSEHVEGFAYELAQCCEPDEISGVIADPAIPAHLRAHLVTRVFAKFTEEAPDLEAVADEAQFMSLSAR